MNWTTRNISFPRESFSLRGFLLLSFVCVWAVGYLVPRLEVCRGITSNLDNALQLEVQRRKLLEKSDTIIANFGSQEVQQHIEISGPLDELAVMRILDDFARKTKVEFVRLGPSQVQTEINSRGAGAAVDIRSDIKSLIQFLYLVEHGKNNFVVSFLNVRLPARQGNKLDVSLTINQEDR